ncbi:MAG: glycosyltransferase family 4 protein [Anaerolineae bacterium]|jgi:glycosyltransferase involved in cell wall biosynthesis
MARIGLITGEYPPDHGGVGDFTEQLARALVSLGHDVHVITSSPTSASTPRPAESTSAPDQVNVHRVVADWGFGCWRRILRLSDDLNLDILNIQYQAAAYDLHPAINLVPGKGRRPPVVVTFHDLKAPYLFPKAGPLREWVVRLLARRADGVIVTNREDELSLPDLRERTPLLVRIPIGSNIQPTLAPGYDRDAERARWGIGRDDLVLGYFGFLNKSKGGEELIEALGLLVKEGSPAHLLKIGGRVGTSDPTNRAYADRVEHLITELNLRERIHRTGYVPSAQVSASLLAVDICVLPYRDGASFRRGSLLACLAHERAIVTTRPAVRLPEVEDGENMVLVDPRDPTGLAQAVLRVSTNPSMQARLEAGARSLATHFTWDSIARQTAAVFGELIADRQ